MKNKMEQQEEKTIEEFVNNPENQKQARLLARQIEGKTNGNWFTLDKVVNKMSQDKDQVAMGLYTLQQFNLLVTQWNEKRGQYEYKIDINHDTELRLLDDEIEAVNGRLEALKQKREKLLREKEN